MTENKKIKGIFFFLFALTYENVPKLLVLREMVDKPALHKKAGMLSVPAETCEPEDDGFEGTIKRMLVEEIDADGQASFATKIMGINEVPSRLIHGREDIDTYYAWGFYQGGIADAALWKPQDNHVELVGWMTIEELLSHEVRIEITPLLQRLATDEGYKQWIASLKR